jgi:hypothetical protein
MITTDTTPPPQAPHSVEVDLPRDAAWRYWTHVENQAVVGQVWRLIQQNRRLGVRATPVDGAWSAPVSQFDCRLRRHSARDLAGSGSLDRP